MQECKGFGLHGGQKIELGCQRQAVASSPDGSIAGLPVFHAPALAAGAWAADSEHCDPGGGGTSRAACPPNRQLSLAGNWPVGAAKFFWGQGQCEKRLPGEAPQAHSIQRASTSTACLRYLWSGGSESRIFTRLIGWDWWWELLKINTFTFS